MWNLLLIENKSACLIGGKIQALCLLDEKKNWNLVQTLREITLTCSFVRQGLLWLSAYFLYQLFTAHFSVSFVFDLHG